MPAVAEGDIFITSLFSDQDGAIDASFSFFTVNALDAGETLSFWEADGIGTASFTYTVGAGGLAAGEFVRFTVPDTGTPTILEDASSGSVSAIGFTGGTTSWAQPSSGNLMVGNSANQLVAAHTNAASATPTDDIGQTTLSLGSFSSGVDLNLPTLQDDNVLWNGGSSFTLADFQNAANWTTQNTLPAGAHLTGDLLGDGSATYATQDLATPCFAPGTLIATATGEIAVETLSIGDMVKTATGELVAVKWIGRHTAVKAFARERMEPVRFLAGSLGNGLPHTDLIVTPDHGMILDGMVVNASALINGSTIDWISMDQLPERMVYYHIETADHNVILANGCATETYVDAPSRQVFDNFAEYLELFGAEKTVAEMALPRVSSQRMLPEAVKACLGITAQVSLARA